MSFFGAFVGINTNGIKICKKIDDAPLMLSSKHVRLMAVGSGDGWGFVGAQKMAAAV